MRIRNLCIHTNHACCNNCFGCNHLSPFWFRDTWRIDPVQLRRDLERLNELRVSAAELHLLGGEPLLHPRLIDCINACTVFSAQRWLKSNGMIPIPTPIWEALHDAKFKVQITNYNLSAAKVQSLHFNSQKFNVPLALHRVSRWHHRFQTPDLTRRHIRHAFRDCDFGGYRYLQDGKLYRCSIDAYGRPFFDKLGLPWADAGVSIWDANFLEKAKHLFKVPTQNCAVCRLARDRKVGVAWRRITKAERERGVNSDV